MSRANGVGARGKNQEHEPYWEVLCHYTARPGAGDISQAHQGSVRKSGNHTSLDPNQSVSHKGHFRSQYLAGSCSAQSSRRKPASPSSLAKRSASSLHSCVLRANLASCFCSVLGGPLKDFQRILTRQEADGTDDTQKVCLEWASVWVTKMQGFP